MALETIYDVAKELGAPELAGHPLKRRRKKKNVKLRTEVGYMNPGQRSGVAGVYNMDRN